MQPSTTPTPPQTDRPLVADDYRTVWATILPGLRALHASSELQDWSIDSVREMLEAELAVLLLDMEAAGAFAIVSIQPSPYREGDSELFIHLAWHQGADALERFQPHLEVMARRCGASQIRFYSGRAGMLPLAGRYGYSARSVEYLKEL
jgi:hypothetical protein